MEEKKELYNCDYEPLLRDIRILMDILNPLIGSYRLLVGAVDELNTVALAHKSDLEAAIERADDVGDIIDDIDKKLKPLIKELIKKMDCKDSSIALLSSDLLVNKRSND